MSEGSRSLTDRLAAYGLHLELGALAQPDPLTALPSSHEPWDGIARELPRFLTAGRTRPAIDALPELTIDGLGPREIDRAMLLLSYLAHAYVFGERPLADRLPANIARPWHAAAQAVGRPPVLAYASDVLQNWRRLDPQRPPFLGNTARLANFRGGTDEDWFVLVHVDIEARGGPAFAGALRARAAADAGDATTVRAEIERISALLEEMRRSLERMPEGCDPHVYYHRIRPFLFGWADNPDLPRGLTYDGVAAYGGVPQRFRGASAAESSLVPAIDALLGLSFTGDELGRYLCELRQLMPAGHRRFIEDLEGREGVRPFVKQAGNARLRAAYDDCLRALQLFRSRHIGFAALYIADQARDAGTGTAGTPFVAFLRAHRDAIIGYLLG